MSTKTCTCCNTSKPLDQFSSQKGRNGIRRARAICRTCGTAKAVAWAKDNPDKRKANWRRNAEENRERYAATSRAYSKRHADRRRATMEAYWAANPEKRDAWHAVAYALKTGTLKRQPCARCGSTQRVQAHHHDYGKPLDIKWLCSDCHGKEHRHAA